LSQAFGAVRCANSVGVVHAETVVLTLGALQEFSTAQRTLDSVAQRPYLDGMELKEHWAHEMPKKRELTEVRIEKIGAKKPARDLVAFVDDEFEGASEWVPPSRLKVPWADVDAYKVREAAWNRLRVDSLDVTTWRASPSTMFSSTTCRSP
jgi:hypothetical protein